MSEQTVVLGAGFGVAPELGRTQHFTLVIEQDQTVLLVHPELRRGMRRLVVRGELELAVLSFRELAGEYNLQAVGTISLTEITNRRTASGVPITSMATAS